MNKHIQYVTPQSGHVLRWLINLLLRLMVKRQMAPRIDIPALRTLLGKPNEHAAKRPLGVQRVPLDCDGVAAQWLIPSPAQAGRVLLYLHGGAFVARSPELHGAMVGNWCRSLQARALMVDYRLAPEHPWPAAADDCLQAYRWLLAQGYRSGDIVIAGDSAGGNLALATLHGIKQAGDPLPACAVLLSPFTDFTLSGDSIVGNARRDPVFTPHFGLEIRRFYAEPSTFLDPGVSPLYGDFSGLPPLLFQVGSTEVLRDDSVRTAQRAAEAGVKVQLQIWDRMPHVWQAIPILPQAAEASSHIVEFVAKNCGWHALTPKSPHAHQRSTLAGLA